MKRKNLFIFLNVAFPLLIGLSIYLFCYKNTYINTFFENYLGINFPYIYRATLLHQFITNWACDILWAYALTFSLYFCFRTFNKSILITSFITVSFAVILECLQLTGIVNGTFDTWDIIMELSAIIIAVIIIKKEFFK